MLRRERHVGQHVLLGAIHHPGKFGDTGPQLVGDLAPLPLGGLGRFLRVGRGDEGRDDPAAALAGVRHGVAGKVHTAALPGGAEHARYRRLDAFMGVRDDELDAA